MKPQGSATPLGQRSWAYVKEWGKPLVCLPTHLRVRGGADHGLGACPYQTDLSSSLRSQDLGRQQIGAD